MAEAPEKQSWLARKIKFIARVFVACVCLLGIGFYKIFWRWPLPKDFVLPKGAKVSVSRSSFVPIGMYKRNIQFIDGWCHGHPKNVAFAWANQLRQVPVFDDDGDRATAFYPPYKLKPDEVTKVIAESRQPEKLSGGFIIPTYTGPPDNVTEVYTMNYPHSECYLGYSIWLWPDGEDTRFSILIRSIGDLPC